MADDACGLVFSYVQYLFKYIHKTLQLSHHRFRIDDEVIMFFLVFVRFYLHLLKINSMSNAFALSENEPEDINQWWCS